MHFIPPIKALILDMDGVLWRGPTLLGDLPVIFARIDRLGLRALLATNNSTLSRKQYQDKFAQMGVRITENQVFNSALATAYFLKNRFPQGAKVYVVGEQGLVETVQHAGFSIADQNVDAVVVGIDRQISYQKLTIASRLIRSGALFIGTNPDRTFPSPDGLTPGAGAILASIQAATDKDPIIIGKPATTLLEMALKEHDLQPLEALMVGDRLDTDILGGQRAGCRTALVLSGVTNDEEAEQWTPQPDIIIANLETLLDVFESKWKK